MTSTTPTSAPADLVGRGGIGVRPAFGPGLCSGGAYLIGPVNAPVAAAQGTALPAADTAARLRFRRVARRAFGHDVATWRFIDNNGTTLGNLSPGRPQS
ncbi:MAG TPA: hypothetical protein VGD12_00335 [Blastococcus sp.]|jgi:hypothetical protein